jgi:hypothetical protein
MDRERSLMTLANGKTGPAQPGLFDRRGARQIEAHDPPPAIDEHQRRVELLGRSASLESRCDLIGILIVTGSHELA